MPGERRSIVATPRPARDSTHGEAGAESLRARVLALQRTAGNRAVSAVVADGGRALMRRPKTGPAGGRDPTVTLTVVPPREMTPEQFAIFVLMQVHGVDADEAAERYEALIGSGPRRTRQFLSGVGSSDVGRPLKVMISVPAPNEGLAEDARARAAELGTLPATTRDAINAEADRRYWARMGGKRGAPIGLGSPQQGNRRLWWQARDEVLRERERVDALAPEVKANLRTDEREPRPEDYVALARIGRKLQGFKPEDWALYHRRVGGSTNDLQILEESIDRFVARQAADRSISDRIKGTEDLYDLVQYATTMAKADNGEHREENFQLGEQMYRALFKAGFKDPDEYLAACASWRELFERRALEVTLYALHSSAQVVMTALGRYRDPAEQASTYNRQVRLRKLLDEAYEAGMRRAPTNEEDERASYEASAKFAAAGAIRKAQVADDPILADPEISTGALNVADPAALGALFVADAQDRMRDIHKTLARVLHDHDAIYQFDHVIAMTLSELGEGPMSIGTKIVDARKTDITIDNVLRSLAKAALAIGLAVLTFGGGTVALVFGAAQVTFGITQAIEEYDRYAEASAAAHTAFDPAQSVSGTEPSRVWVALALIGAGLDTAALVSAVKAVGPAVELLEETGDVVRFEAKLAEATGVAASKRAAVARAGRARAEFQDSAKDLAETWRRGGAPFVLSGTFGLELLAKVTRTAYHYAKLGLREFGAFLAELRVQKFMKGIDVDALTAEQLEALEHAFQQGVAEWDGTSWLRLVYGGRQVEITYASDGSLLLDGRALRGAERDNVMTRLGLKHADAGHGPFRPREVIAGEAVKNAVRGEGMAGQFFSDEAMLQSAALAKIRRLAGEGYAVQPGQAHGSGWIVEFEAPGTGRVYAEQGSVPTGAIVSDAQPVPNLPVVELPATHVRALFEGDEITSLFPIHVPPPPPPPVSPPAPVAPGG